jgi:hypothetical protein
MGQCAMGQWVHEWVNLNGTCARAHVWALGAWGRLHVPRGVDAWVMGGGAGDRKDPKGGGLDKRKCRKAQSNRLSGLTGGGAALLV